MYETDSEEGRLEDFKPLSEFHLKQEYGTFSSEDACNFGVHVYSDGDVLSIFTGAGEAGLLQCVSSRSFCYLLCNSHFLSVKAINKISCSFLRHLRIIALQYLSILSKCLCSLKSSPNGLRAGTFPFIDLLAILVIILRANQ